MGGSERITIEKIRDDQIVKRVTKYLHDSIPLRDALQLSKRVNYFRGKMLIDALTSTENGKYVCTTQEEAIAVGNALLQHGMVHSSRVKDKKRRELEPINDMVFTEDGYYTWIFEGSSTMRNLMLGALVVCLLIMVLYPIWPQSAKVGTWYVSVTLLIFLFLLLTIRLIVYVIFWSIGFEFWILPNFFDDNLGVMDSFRPLVSFNRAEDLKDTWYFRAFGLGLVIAFGYWCSQQPTEFDELYAQQMDFLSELYEGKLLGDAAQFEEQVKVREIPKLEDLERDVQDDQDDFVALSDDPSEERDLDALEAENDAAMDAMLEAEESTCDGDNCEEVEI